MRPIRGPKGARTAGKLAAEVCVESRYENQGENRYDRDTEAEVQSRGFGLRQKGHRARESVRPQSDDRGGRGRRPRSGEPRPLLQPLRPDCGVRQLPAAPGQRKDRHRVCRPAGQRQPRGRPGVRTGRREGHLLREAHLRKPRGRRSDGRRVQVERHKARMRRPGAEPARLLEGTRDHRVGRAWRGTDHQHPVRKRHSDVRRRVPELQPDANVRRRRRRRVGDRVGSRRPHERLRPGSGGLRALRQRRRVLHDPHAERPLRHRGAVQPGRILQRRPVPSPLEDRGRPGQAHVGYSQKGGRGFP